MTSRVSHSLIQKIYKNISEAKGLEELHKLSTQYKFEDIKKEYLRKYPELAFRITTKDFKAFALLFTKDYKLKKKIHVKDPIAKILLSFIWKQGDLSFLKHLFLGMSETKPSAFDQSIIIRQFGRSLLKIMEPIADQHVLRGFEVYSLTSFDDRAVERIRRKGSYDANDNDVLEKYRAWFENILIKFSKADRLKAKKLIDFLLYAVGKKIKLYKKVVL